MYIWGVPSKAISMNTIKACFRFWCTDLSDVPPRKDEQVHEAVTIQPSGSGEDTLGALGGYRGRSAHRDHGDQGGDSSPEEPAAAPRKYRAMSMPANTANRVRLNRRASTDVNGRKSSQMSMDNNINNVRLGSIASFVKARGDVYGGDFGRVRIKKGDLGNNRFSK